MAACIANAAHTLTVRPNQPIATAPLDQNQALPSPASPSWRNPDLPTAHDRFRSIFRNHWHIWRDLRLVCEVPPDQQAYDRRTIERMMLCRDPNSGYARYVCPSCGFDRHAPFSCKARFCPSYGKVKFFPKGLDAAAYIGRYLGHPPLATCRITDDGQNVTYWYVDSSTAKRVLVTCSALDFISRMGPHIPPKGMQMVHYAGLYACNTKRMAEIWEPRRSHIWMKRWLEAHRYRRAARLALEQIRATFPCYRQLRFNFETQR